MNVTYYGHSCFMVETGGSQILFDPFITPNELAGSIEISKIRPDHILLSHAHEDHLADALAIAQSSGAKLVSNYEIVNWFGQKGLTNTHSMNLGGKCTFDFGTVKYVNAIHSSVFPDGTSGGNPGGFVVRSEAGTFYYAGDTALTMDMRLIGRTSKLDFAFLPIGDNYTMGIDDAVIAAEFIGCSRIIGMHYDTFGPIRIDHEEAMRKFKVADLTLILMKIGETRKM